MLSQVSRLVGQITCQVPVRVPAMTWGQGLSNNLLLEHPKGKGANAHHNMSALNFRVAMGLPVVNLSDMTSLPG